MNNINKHSIATSSAKAGFSQSTGYRIKADPRFPFQKKPRGSRRPDPLRGLFEQEVIPMLEECKDIQSVGVYHELLRRHPDLNPGIRHTLERRIREWRAKHGADKDVIFPQTKIAGCQLRLKKGPGGQGKKNELLLTITWIGELANEEEGKISLYSLCVEMRTVLLLGVG